MIHGRRIHHRRDSPFTDPTDPSAPNCLTMLERMISSPPMKKNPHAVALGRLGGRVGGPARARCLSTRERATIAREAAMARWSTRPGNLIRKDRQLKLPAKLLGSAFTLHDIKKYRLPRDFEAVVMTILSGGTQVQKNWLCQMFGREAVAQVVRRWRGSFLNSKSQLHEWVSRSTARKWARENPEMYAWSQSR